MPLFEFNDEEALGRVVSVDTTTVTARVENLELLKRLQVNRLVVLQSAKAGVHLIGIVTRITRKTDGDFMDNSIDDSIGIERNESNLVRITLIGTLHDRHGVESNVFRRTLEIVPDIDANCFALEESRLTSFVQVISHADSESQRLSLGTFTLDENAEAFLNGDKLFQRHALIVGSTGSGKSWTVARLLDQIGNLPQANAILFDIHGEYKPLAGDECRHVKVASPADLERGSGLTEGVLHLPYWLFGYEALVALFVDRTDQNAPNQAAMMMNAIRDAKRRYLTERGHTEYLEHFTVDSPIPFELNQVVDDITRLNEEMIEGSRGLKQGPYHDKLTRMLARLESKRADRRLGFLFQAPEETLQLSWLEQMVHELIDGRGSQTNNCGGIKIIDLSEVPSDVLPLVVSLLGKLVFTTNQWSSPQSRHPIAIFCDEAHLYIPERPESNGSDSISIEVFERIAKEGRKYGVGLVVISQRPSEVNRTVLSQCNNVIAMRLTNADDQNVIRRLLPDSLGGFGDLLPILDTGEALVVGDAILLPTRVRVAHPVRQPNSQTVAFWSHWNESSPKSDTTNAIRSWRRQSFVDS